MVPFLGPKMVPFLAPKTAPKSGQKQHKKADRNSAKIDPGDFGGRRPDTQFPRTRSRQEPPGAARRRQETPGAARSRQMSESV